MSDTIRRWECGECGWTASYAATSCFRGPHGVPVERVYVAVDALLGPAAIEATDHVMRAGRYEDEKIVAHDATILLHAAIDAVTGEQP